MTRGTWVLGIALILVHGLLALHCAMHNSATYDEVVYPSAGYAMWSTGDPDINPEHPPLMKRALGATWLGADLPPVEAVPGYDQKNQWVFGQSLLFGDWKLAPGLLLRARLLNIFVTAALCTGILVTATRWFGARAGIAALAIYALDPLTIAHSGLATLDIPSAASIFAAMLAAHAAFATSRPSRAVAAGALAGVALAIKVSAVVLIPALIAMAYFSKPNRERRPWLRHPVAVLVVIAVTAVIIVLAAGLPDPGSWLRAWDMQNQHAKVGDPAFALGLRSTNGWWWYYPVAWLIKTPIAILLATAAGAALVARAAGQDIHRSITLLAVPMVLFAYSLHSHVDIGVRQLLAVTPFLAIAGGIAADRVAKSKAGQTLLSALALWLVIGTIRVHPSEIAYANELAGGPSHLHRLLSDSNVDWGQALPDLAGYVRKQPVLRLWLRYFGTGIPEAYGITNYRRVSGRSLGRHDNSDGPDPTGKELLAISAYHLMDVGADRQVSQWFRERRPVAVPGHAIAVFDITNDSQAYRQLATMAERIDDPTSAWQAWQRVAELDAQSTEPLAGMARALSRLGRKRDAETQCKVLLEHAPSAKASDCEWK